MVVDGTRLFGMKHIIEGANDYFRDADREVLPLLAIDWSLLQLPVADTSGLSCDPFLADEIKEAVMSSKGDSSPGPDGFPMCFYQHFWSIIDVDVIRAVNDFSHGHRKLHPINFSWLFLFPKFVGSEDIDNFRPISLANCSYKIITKCIANRLKLTLDNIIDPMHTAFLSGRSILDSVALVDELLAHLHETKTPGMILKIDFKKAFDRINWSFILECLRRRGFPQLWVDWVEAIILSSHAAVLVNGEGGRFFKVHRGLKQGCPLSPLLFILAVDTLNGLLRHNASQNGIMGIGPSGGWSLLNLQFTDDTILCIRPTSQAIRRLRLILTSFSLSSGLDINYTKSTC